jgi:hypothetical protein
MDLVRWNPEMAPARAQGVRLFTATVVGPALVWSGYKYPGTFRSKTALSLLGAVLVAVNYAAFRAHSEPEPEPEHEPEAE